MIIKIWRIVTVTVIIRQEQKSLMLVSTIKTKYSGMCDSNNITNPYCTTNDNDTISDN